jgi:hypothetical protein
MKTEAIQACETPVPSCTVSQTEESSPRTRLNDDGSPMTLVLWALTACTGVPVSQLTLGRRTGTERKPERRLQFKTGTADGVSRMIKAFSLYRAVITSTVDSSLLLKPVSRDWNRYYVVINEPPWCADIRTDAISTHFLIQLTKHDSIISS